MISFKDYMDTIMQNKQMLDNVCCCSLSGAFIGLYWNTWSSWGCLGRLQNLLEVELC